MTEQDSPETVELVCSDGSVQVKMTPAVGKVTAESAKWSLDDLAEMLSEKGRFSDNGFWPSKWCFIAALGKASSLMQGICLAINPGNLLADKIPRHNEGAGIIDELASYLKGPVPEVPSHSQLN